MEKIARKSWLTLLASLAAIIVYALILSLPIPSAIGLFVRYNLVVLSLIALPLIFFAFRARGFWGTFSAFGLTLLLFGLPLSGLWRSGASEPFIITGLLPFSDAASYYSDALRVVEGFRFSPFSARRPLFPALLTLLLALTGQNLVISIAILGALIATACYLAARQVQRSLGDLPAVVFLFILFLFYRRIAGTTMTENLGLPLGVAAFIILWGAAQKKNLWQAAAGLLFLTLALNARAGTFFILPALVLWTGFAFKGTRKFSISALGLSTAAVALGFLLNMMVFRLIADPGGMVFSNFSYTLYGVVAGGKGWMQILIDHPELAQLEDVARSAQTYALVFDAWKAHPFNIIIGAFKNWFDYLMPRGAGAFGFIRGDEALSWVNYAYRIVLSILAGWGLVTAWKRRRQEPFAMMLWAAAGIFLSVPFVPPNDSNQMRVYAATVAFLITFCVIGLRSLLDLIGKNPKNSVNLEPVQTGSVLAFASILSICTIGGALLVKALTSPQEIQAADCPAGQAQFITRIASGSLVMLASNASDGLSGQINVPLAGFIERFEGYPEMHEALVDEVGEGTVLARPLDLNSMEYPLLLIKESAGDLVEGLASICAVPPESEELVRRGWWKVTSITHISDTASQ